MKIAIYHNLPSGGGKRALYEMTRRMVERHAIDVYTLSAANHAFCDLRPFIHHHHVYDVRPLPLFSSPFGALNHGVRWLDLLRLQPLMQTIARDINRGGYDLVIAHADQYTQGPLVLKYLKSPSIYYCQDVLRHHYDPKIARPYATLTGVRAVVDRLNILRILYHQTVASMDRSSLKSATMILVNSRFSMETTYRVYGVRPYVCYLGVDTQLFNPDNQSQEGSRASYVISVGSIAPPKGFDFIIQGLGQISEHQRPHLLLVGNYVSDDERLYLQGLSDRLGVTLEFRPLVSDAELVQLYRQAQCTAYAPILEPFGFVPLESMACGTPVVGVAEGGVRETIQPGKTGLLVERDPKSFGNALGGLLQDPERLRTMGERGPAYVKEEWNWDKTVTRLEDLMQRALAMGKEKA